MPRACHAAAAAWQARGALWRTHGQTCVVARIIRVADPGDERLADYVRLRDVNLRRSLEAEHGMFLAEGEKVIRRAMAAEYPVRSLLLTSQHLAGLADLLDGCAAPAYVVTDQVAEQLTGFVVHRGALASCLRVPLPTVADVTNGRRLVARESLADHVGVGSPLPHAEPSRRGGSSCSRILLTTRTSAGSFDAPRRSAWMR